MLEPTTLITKGPKAAIQKVRERRLDIEKTMDTSKALDVVGETLTATAGYAALTLGAAAPAAAGRAALSVLPKTPKAILGTVTGAGILTTSKTARNYVTKVLQDPTKLGREAGLLIDKAATGKDVGGVVDSLKTAGLIGAGIAATVGAQKLYTGIKDKISQKSVSVLSPSEVPVASVVTPTTLSAGTVPVATETSAVDNVIEKAVSDVQPVQAPDVNVKVINKPQINVAVAQSL
jgi:hypothetical protein